MGYTKQSHKNTSTQLNSKDYIEMVHLYFHKLLFIQFSVEREENPVDVCMYIPSYQTSNTHSIYLCIYFLDIICDPTIKTGNTGQENR